MNLSLRPEHQQLIESQISSGRYTNPDEIIAEALDLLIKRDRYNLWVEEVRHKVEAAAASLDSAEPTLRERGEGVDSETAIAQIRARLHQRSESRSIESMSSSAQ
jgi:antitoxin ParD1/3/4